MVGTVAETVKWFAVDRVEFPNTGDNPVRARCTGYFTRLLWLTRIFHQHPGSLMKYPG